MRNYLLLFMSFWLVTSASAQVNNPQFNIQQVKFRLDSLDYKISQSSKIVFESQFMSRVVYSGRDYGLKGFGTTGQLTYQHKSGFWLSTVGYFWEGSKVKFPKADIAVGYALSLDEHLSASFGYSRWMYFGRSEEELRWVFSDFLSTYWTIDLGFMGLSPSFYYQIGKSENVAQFALTASKYKELKKPFLGGKLIFEPNFTWMMSSRDRYYVAQPDKPSGKIVRVIDYELVFPVTYRRVGKFDFSPKVHLTLPVNVLSYDGAEDGKPFIYFTANLKVLLWRHKERTTNKRN
jgi:hypothetical protein